MICAFERCAIGIGNALKPWTPPGHTESRASLPAAIQRACRNSESSSSGSSRADGEQRRRQARQIGVERRHVRMPAQRLGHEVSR